MRKFHVTLFKCGSLEMVTTFRAESEFSVEDIRRFYTEKMGKPNHFIAVQAIGKT
jgi:hypothetical protein